MSEYFPSPGETGSETELPLLYQNLRRACENAGVGDAFAKFLDEGHDFGRAHANLKPLLMIALDKSRAEVEEWLGTEYGIRLHQDDPLVEDEFRKW